MAKKKDRSGEVLVDICSSLEYDANQAGGEGLGDVVHTPLTAVRYTNTKSIPSFQVVTQDHDIYEITAHRIGPATREQLIDLGIIEEEAEEKGEPIISVISFSELLKGYKKEG